MPSKLCEICNEEKPLIRYSAMMVCASCVQNEINAQKHIAETADERVADMNAKHEELKQVDILAKQVEIDYSAKIVTDKFNQDTTSIIELKAAIEADDSIENKIEELFRRLKTRFDYDQELIFGAQQVIEAAGNRQRTTQQYFNEYSNKLRVEIREELRIQDLTYKVKPPTKPKKQGLPKKKKYDREALARAVEEIKEKTGVQVFASTIQGMCISYDIEPHQVLAKMEELKKKVAV